MIIIDRDFLMEYDKLVKMTEMPLPNGKALLRLDYKKEKTHV